MIAILDTSSLLAFVRYYLPFDKKEIFRNLLRDKFENDQIIILDKVVDEAKYMAQGIILSELDFINNKKKIINTAILLPTNKFFNLLENQFCNKDIIKLRAIDDAAYEIEKSNFLQSADANLILYAISIASNNPIVVTEESKNSNDQKIFKKIPSNCKSIGVECCNLPHLFKHHYQLDMDVLQY